MNNIWYHGSPKKNLIEFRIDLPRYESLEGNGVYLTQNYRIARGYAGPEGSVYRVEFTGALLNLKDREELYRIISIASKICDLDISNLPLVEQTLDLIIEGRYQIGNHKGVGIGWQIKNILLSSEDFISRKDSESIALEVENGINDYLFEHDAWLYEDIKLGSVIVIKNPDKINILKEIDIGSLEDENLLD